MAEPLCALVTGANRGLGLALARDLLERRDALVAMGLRDPANAASCHELLDGRRQRGLVVHLDYADAGSAASAATACRSWLGHLDLLVNCGGVNAAPGYPPGASKGPLGQLDPQALLAVLGTNVVGPVLTCQAFLPLLRRSARPCVVNVSGGRGSLAAATEPGSFGYAVSKAALNMATRKMAAQLGLEGGVAVAVDPGWVRTRMGGPDAPGDPDVAAARLIDLVLGRAAELNGRFVTVDGRDVPW